MLRRVLLLLQSRAGEDSLPLQSVLEMLPAELPLERFAFFIRTCLRRQQDAAAAAAVQEKLTSTEYLRVQCRLVSAKSECLHVDLDRCGGRRREAQRNWPRRGLCAGCCTDHPRRAWNSCMHAACESTQGVSELREATRGPRLRGPAKRRVPSRPVRLARHKRQETVARSLPSSENVADSFSWGEKTIAECVVVWLRRRSLLTNADGKRGGAAPGTRRTLLRGLLRGSAVFGLAKGQVLQRVKSRRRPAPRLQNPLRRESLRRASPEESFDGRAALHIFIRLSGVLKTAQGVPIDSLRHTSSESEARRRRPQLAVVASLPGVVLRVGVIDTHSQTEVRILANKHRLAELRHKNAS